MRFSAHIGLVSSVTLGLLAAGLASSSAEARTLNINASDSAMAVDAVFVNGTTGTGDFLDGPVPEPGAGGNNVLRAGQFGGRIQRPIVAIPLPALDPNEVLVGANFRFSTAFDSGNPQFGADLEAIGVRSSGTIQASDYEEPGTLIDDGVLFPGVPDFSTRRLDVVGEASLLTYLTTNYSAGDFLFLRFTTDTISPPDFKWYRIFAHNSGSGSTPRLELETFVIPEPATAGAGLVGLIAVGMRRRRSSV
ncbi:MAG: hypothetical protein AAF561_04970 [Planctomycetota bacterium]